MFDTWTDFLAWLAATLGDDAAAVEACNTALDGDDVPEGITADSTPDVVVATLLDETVDTLSAALRDAAQDDAVTLDDLTAIADALDYLDAEVTYRETEAAEADGRRADLLQRIAGQDGGDDTEGEPEGDDAEPEAGTDEAPADDNADEPVPVTASTPRRPAPGRVAANRRSRTARRDATPPARTGPEFVAMRRAGMVAAGDQVRMSTDGGDRDRSVGAMFAATAELVRRGGGNGEYEPVVRLQYEFPEERHLRSDDPDGNSRKIAAVIDGHRHSENRLEAGARLDAIVAAGGLCAPLMPYYGLQELGNAGRPVRDFLPSFTADRGGIVFQPPPSFAAGDFAGGVDVWTAANDANPTDPTTKPCLTIDCNENEEVELYAVTDCVEVSNFRQRSFPEQNEVYVNGSRMVHAQTADTSLITAIAAASTAQVAPQAIGFTRDVLFYVDLHVAAYRSRNRMDNGETLDIMLPNWVGSAMRANLVRELPGDGLEKLAVADAMIDGWFRSRGLRVGYFRDTQQFGALTPGAELEWKSTITWYLWAPGSFLFLDGGTLDLGLVRDSTLNALNRARYFSETFEALAFIGTDAVKVTQDVCLDGSTSGTVDPSTLCGVS